MNTATALNIDKDEYRNRKIVLELYHKVLFPYIANANERDVMEKLYQWLDKGDFTLISKAELKTLEAIKNTVLDASMMEHKPPFIVER